MHFDKNKYVAFDVETSGTYNEYALQPFRYETQDFWVTCFSLAYNDSSANKITVKGKLFPTVDELRSILSWAIKNDKVLVAWNAPYDAAVCIALGLGDLVNKAKWLDSALLWKHLTVDPEYDIDKNRKRGFRLEDAMNEYYPNVENHKGSVDFHATDPESLAALLHYCKLDTMYTLKLANKFWVKLEDSQIRPALIEARSIPMIANCYVQGLYIKQDAALALRDSLEQVRSKSLSELEQFGVTETIVRSPKKLAALLFDDWGLPCLKTNIGKKTGIESRSTDKETLHELAFVDPRAKTLRTFREAINNTTKFVANTFESLEYNGDGRVRPIPKIFGTYSGRMTYSSKQGRNKDERQTGIPLHQWKRGKDFRRQIAAPPGFVLCETDAASQEYKLMACASGDETMLSLCQPGQDPHSYMTAQIFSQDYLDFIKRYKAGEAGLDDQRKLGKVANLSCQYRTSAPKLRVVARVQYDIPMEDGEAKHIHSTYRKTYPGVVKYWNRQIKKCQQLGYAETFAGRRVKLEGNWSGKDGWSLGSTAINYPIQGTGADMKYLALAAVKDFLTQNRCYFYYELHDGLFWLLPENDWERCAHGIHDILNSLPYEKAWGWVPPVHLNWDCKVGPTWGDLKDLQ